MSNFNRLVKEKELEFRSFRDAEKNALETFNREKRSVLERSVESRNSFLQPGKMYTFSYNPIGRDSLDFYDKNPLVLTVDRRKLKNGRVIDIAINLNFLPYRTKVNLVATMVRSYGLIIKGNRLLAPNRANSQSQLPINWFIAKRLLGKAAKYAIRTYYPNRRSQTYAFSYEKWVELMFLNVKDIEGASLQEIYKTYKTN